ncbi:BMP family ABC transporter substrate-binding protein, partial [Halorubrum sp. SP3]|uniref:BMP family lipoprotein n=1 Tax=Halorubrum sp. SP3 TaxID=1537265 RepID=UPI0010F556FA
GNTGTGVFQAAQEQGKFAIGVDRDQSVTRPDYADVILGSMVKRVDTAVYNAIEATVDEEFPGGSNVALGLGNDGVALVYGDQLGSEIPDDVTEEVATARENIIAGDIDVPSSPARRRTGCCRRPDRSARRGHRIISKHIQSRLNQRVVDQWPQPSTSTG